MSAPRAALLLLLLFALAGCGSRSSGDEASVPAATAVGGGVENLDNVLQLRAAFEADKGKTRLLVLFSPT